MPTWIIIQIKVKQWAIFVCYVIIWTTAFKQKHIEPLRQLAKPLIPQR